MPEKRTERFESIKQLNLRTSRAWAIEETLRHLWEYTWPGAARRFFEWWFGWARRSRLAPIRKLATPIKQDLDGILTYCRHGVTHGVREGINSTIITIKRLAGGFRTPTTSRPPSTSTAAGSIYTHDNS